MIKGYPTDARGSWYGRNFWCSEEIAQKATLKIVRIRPKRYRRVESGGRQIHDLLTFRKYPKETEEFWNMIKGMEPLYFDFPNEDSPTGYTRIYFHPDAYLVQNNIVETIEWKTVDSKPNRFIYPMGRVQLLVYLYGLKQILPEQFQLKHQHRVMYWKRFTKTKKKLKLIEVKRVYLDDREIEDIIRSCHLIWAKKVLPMPPAEFKCRQCPFVVRRNCRFYTGKIPLGWKNWSHRFIKGVKGLQSATMEWDGWDWWEDFEQEDERFG